MAPDSDFNDPCHDGDEYATFDADDPALTPGTAECQPFGSDAYYNRSYYAWLRSIDNRNSATFDTDDPVLSYHESENFDDDNPSLHSDPYDSGHDIVSDSSISEVYSASSDDSDAY